MQEANFMEKQCKQHKELIKDNIRKEFKLDVLEKTDQQTQRNFLWQVAKQAFLESAATHQEKNQWNQEKNDECRNPEMDGKEKMHHLY